MPRKKAKRSKPYKARPTGQRDVQIEFPRGFAGNNQLADQFDDTEEFLQEKMEEMEPIQAGASRSGRATSLEQSKLDESVNLKSRSRTKVTGPVGRNARGQKDGGQG